MPQHLDLSDDEAAGLTQELHDIVENDRYPFSPRIRTLRAVLNKPRPEPAREPLPTSHRVRADISDAVEGDQSFQFGSLTGDGFSRSTFINDNSVLSLRRLETEAQRLGPIFTFSAPPEARYPRRVRVGRAAGEKTPLIAALREA